MKILTSYYLKPIPMRHFDWIAWIDGMEEEGPYGNGETKEESLSSLLESAELIWDNRDELCNELSHAYCLLDMEPQNERPSN